MPPPFISEHFQDTLISGEIIIHLLYAGSVLVTEEKVKCTWECGIWLGDKVTFK